MWEKNLKNRDVCIYITDSLCCKAETNTSLQIHCTSIKITFKKKNNLLLSLNSHPTLFSHYLEGQMGSLHSPQSWRTQAAASWSRLCPASCPSSSWGKSSLPQQPLLCLFIMKSENHEMMGLEAVTPFQSLPIPTISPLSPRPLLSRHVFSSLFWSFSVFSCL